MPAEPGPVPASRPPATPGLAGRLRPSTRRLRSRLLALAVVLGVGASIVLAPTPAGADELTEKRAQAAAASAKLADLDSRLQSLSYEAEVAKGELHQAEQAVAEARARADEAQADLAARREQLRRFAVGAYVTGSDQRGAEAIFSSDGDQAPQIQGYLRATTSSRKDLIDGVQATRQRAEDEGRQLADAQRDLADRNESLERSLDAAEAAAAEQSAIASRLDAEVNRLVEEARRAEQARRAEEARAEAARLEAAREAAEQQTAPREASSTSTTEAPRTHNSTPAPTAPTAPTAPAPESTSPAPAVGNGASAAVAAAMSKIGAPYVWAAAGPNSFDCSGFTQWAWKHGGKNLYHYTGSQLSASRRISAAEAQPGDLVFFWGPGTSGDPGHVGLYLGGGSFIHAPGTGKSVRIDSVGYWSGARVAYGRV